MNVSSRRRAGALAYFRLTPSGFAQPTRMFDSRDASFSPAAVVTPSDLSLAMAQSVILPASRLAAAGGLPPLTISVMNLARTTGAVIGVVDEILPPDVVVVGVLGVLGVDGELGVTGGLAAVLLLLLDPQADAPTAITTINGRTFTRLISRTGRSTSRSFAQTVAAE